MLLSLAAFGSPSPPLKKKERKNNHFCFYITTLDAFWPHAVLLFIYFFFSTGSQILVSVGFLGWKGFEMWREKQQTKTTLSAELRMAYIKSVGRFLFL